MMKKDECIGVLPPHVNEHPVVDMTEGTDLLLSKPTTGANFSSWYNSFENCCLTEDIGQKRPACPSKHWSDVGYLQA